MFGLEQARNRCREQSSSAEHQSLRWLPSVGGGQGGDVGHLAVEEVFDGPEDHAGVVGCADLGGAGG